MLVLTRRTGQSILVGDDIVVTILELSRDQVRIGIRAPRSVSVHREEVYEEIRNANRAAADANAGVAASATAEPQTSLNDLPRRPG